MDSWDSEPWCSGRTTIAGTTNAGISRSALWKAVQRTTTPSALSMSGEYERMSDRDYYRLSNSNVIEIDSYLEGEHYPAYDSFTHRMLGKKSYLGPESRASFWERVAFYNWIQHYLPGPVEDFSYDRWEPVFMQDLPAFEDVLRELRPQAVLVWTEPLRQFLDRHCASLEGISLVRTGVIEMEALEAWEYRVGYEGEPVRPVRRNKAQFRTFQSIIRSSSIGLRLCTEKSVSDLALILKGAYSQGILQVEECSDHSRRIICVGKEEDVARLIDNIRRNVKVEGSKRGLEINDIQQLLGTEIQHVPQMLYRLRNKSIR